MSSDARPPTDEQIDEAFRQFESRPNIAEIVAIYERSARSEKSSVAQSVSYSDTGSAGASSPKA